MIKNSKSGSSTKTGLIFQNRTDFIKSLKNISWFTLIKTNIGKEIYKIINNKNNKKIGYIFKKYELYRFIKYLDLNDKEKII